ncbi:MAG: WD40/YVTN/BNR-like repeat-containing protein, partial [Anaerolineae bacterium]
MTIKQFLTQRRWHLMGPVLPGGTLYTMVLSPNKEQHNPLLAGTPVGVFRSLSRGDNWSWANRGLVGLQVATLAASSNGVLFLGTLDGTLARSVDGGYSWASLPRLEDSGSITSIAVSPDYLNDGTILVGTENGGIYRSTDSGRSAKPANFGLGDLSVLTIACAPGWP